MGALMRRKSKPKGHRGPCSFCGRVHPRGKSQKRKKRALGWDRCQEVAAQRGHRKEQQSHRKDVM